MSWNKLAIRTGSPKRNVRRSRSGMGYVFGLRYIFAISNSLKTTIFYYRDSHCISKFGGACQSLLWALRCADAIVSYLSITSGEVHIPEPRQYACPIPSWPMEQREVILKKMACYCWFSLYSPSICFQVQKIAWLSLLWLWHTRPGKVTEPNENLDRIFQEIAPGRRIFIVEVIRPSSGTRRLFRV